MPVEALLTLKDRSKNYVLTNRTWIWPLGRDHSLNREPIS